VQFFLPLMLSGGCSLQSLVDDTASVNDEPEVDTMEEEACSPIETAVTADDTTPLGFMVAEAIEWVTNTWMGTMAHSDGSTTMGVVQTEWTGGPIVMVTHDAPASGIEIFCMDHLRIGVPLTLSTQDGSFNFTLVADAKVSATEEWTTSVEAAADENLGSHDLDGGTYMVSKVASGEEESGDVAVITEGSDGDAVWISQDVVLSWPEAP